MKLVRIIDERFHAALQKVSTGELPLKVAFKMRGIINQVNDEYAKYEEVRKNALHKYGTKNKDGTLKLDDNNVVQFSKDSMKEFAKELSDLGSLDIDLPKLKASELGNDLKISQEEAGLLFDIVDLD